MLFNACNDLTVDTASPRGTCVGSSPFIWLCAEYKFNLRSFSCGSGHSLLRNLKFLVLVHEKLERPLRTWGGSCLLGHKSAQSPPL